jgi:protocatechuate 3,4-dioxygenase beta subunit
MLAGPRRRLARFILYQTWRRPAHAAGGAARARRRGTTAVDTNVFAGLYCDMRLLPVLVLTLTCFVPAMAQQGVPEGSVALDGRVHAADDGRPLPGARVGLVGDGAEIAPVYTGRDGRFTLDRPTAGDYTIAVGKAGFAPVHLSPGTADPLVIQLERGAVVQGRVIDAYGEPVWHAGVRVRPAGSSRGGSGDRSAITDDRGEYRIGSLPADTYEVSLVSMAPSASGDLEALLVPMPAEPVVISLRPGDVRAIDLDYEPGEPPSVAAAAVARFTRGDTPGGTGSIRGRVVGPGGRPIEGALISTISAWAPGFVPPAPGVTVSDAAGRYVIRGLHPGRYRLRARVPGFVAQEYGRTRADGTGMSITVRDDHHVQGIDLTLTRGSAITGRVVDRHGEPLEGILLQIWSPGSANGRVTLTPGTRVQRTDDRGVFRLAGLLPGVYYVAAVDDGGRWHVGDDQLTTPGARDPDLQRAPRVFYPVSTGIADALPVHVGVGLDAGGTDIVFDPAPGARVHGVARDAAGATLAGTVTLDVSVRSGVPAVNALRATVAADGSFEVVGVPPGDYVLRAQMAGPVLVPEFGSRFVTVADRDEGPIVLQTGPLAEVRGTIALEQADVPAGFRPAAGPGMMLSAAPADLDRSARAQGGFVGDDWRVTMSGLAGPTRFVLHRAPPGWWLKSVEIDGVNAAEEPVDFAPARVHEGVRFVVSGNAATLSGHALDERGERMNDYRVIVFARDPRHWYDRSPRLKTGEPDLQGSFLIDSLPPGEYLVAAVSGTFGAGAAGDWWNQDVLPLLVGGAARVSLGEGQRVSLDLRVMRLSLP